MKTAILTKDMRPWRKGDTIIVADDTVDQLVASGEATDPGPWPPGSPEVKPKSGIRTIPGARYFTKGK